MKTLLFLLIAALLLPMSIVRATEDDEIVTGPVSPTAEQRDIQFGFPNFDQLIFQGHPSAKQAETQMTTRTDLQVAEIDRVCQLSEAQKQKLELAARGDLLRFLSQVAVLREHYETRLKAQKGGNQQDFQQVWMEMQLELQPVQRRAQAGLTSDPKSLFMKVLPRTLTAEQQRAYNVVVEERRRFRYEANIETALLQLEQTLSFTDSQREALTKLLTAMPPPKSNNPYISYTILIRLGCLPEEQIKPLFTASQWKALSPQLSQYKGWRQQWIDGGVIDAEDVALGEKQEQP